VIRTERTPFVPQLAHYSLRVFSFPFRALSKKEVENMTKPKKKTRKIYKSYSWQVKGLILVNRQDFTIKVEPLHIPRKVSQQLLELSGLD
jgi:hypothetical protein